MVVVQKYGGTSVGSPAQIKSVAQKIAARRAQNVDLVVVVSAMGQTTDELLQLAHQVSPRPEERELDMLLSVGERISMSLLSMALADLGVAAVSLTGSQSGIITTNQHGNAEIEKILGDRIRQNLESGKVVIVAGFQGMSSEREITTLGRGGSDTTAVTLATRLAAEQCEIYTDVEGVFSADPHLVESARKYDQVSYGWMLSMAEHGAQVLHPRAVRAGEAGRLKIWTGRDLEQGGTWIQSKPASAVGITCKNDRAFVIRDEGGALSEVISVAVSPETRDDRVRKLHQEHVENGKETTT